MDRRRLSFSATVVGGLYEVKQVKAKVCSSTISAQIASPLAKLAILVCCGPGAVATTLPQTTRVKLFVPSRLPR